MDKIREEFEAWFLKEMEIDISQYRNHDPRTNVEWPYDGGNDMASQVFTIAYKAWQASRKALVVTMPDKISLQNIVNGRVLPEAESYDEAIDDCADAIRELGITVKQ